MREKIVNMFIKSITLSIGLLVFCVIHLYGYTKYEIDESTDWISEINENISDGDTIMFISDGGSYYTPEDGVLPAVRLVLTAKPGLVNKPVLSTGSAGTLLKVNANITIKGLAFDGLWAENGDGGPYRLLRVYSNFQKMIIEDCDFYNCRAYGVVSNAPILDSLIINNCTFYDMDKVAVYFKDVAGLVNYADIKNSSFWNISDIGIYIYKATDIVEVSNCTFYGLDNINAYLKECVYGTVIRNNIFMSDSAMAIKIYGAAPVVEYNCFYNNSTNIEYVGDPPLTFPIGNIYTDPGFQNAEEGNFALASSSFCVGSAADGRNMGDPRWSTYSVGTDSVNILFSVTVPSYTPELDTVFIAASINDWDSAGYPMTKMADTLWQIIIKVEPNSSIEYKYTRGNWETVEKDFSGAEIENHVVEVVTNSIIVIDEVASWRDISIPVYPQNIAPILTYYNDAPQTSIAVTWASDSQGVNIIYYGVDNISEHQMTVDSYKDLVDDGDSLIHIAYLTDLTPNTTYQYKVETEGVYASDILNFTTADNTTDEFMFVVGGDNQRALVPEVLDCIIAQEPRFMLHVGDLVVNGINLKEWYSFMSRFDKFTGKYVMMPVYGNHEEDSPVLHRLFQLPTNNSTDPGNEGHWFSFDYNNAHFIGLDVQREYVSGSDQYEWLVNDLESVGPDIDHLIVYFHQPAYNTTGYHGPNLHVREALEPLLIQYGVDIVFSGHNHYYERSLANGITYITTGGLGSYLKDFDEGTNPWAVYTEKVNHFCRVSVDGPDLKVEMVRADGSIGDVYESLKIDGNDSDWLSSGLEPLLDTDHLQTDPNLKLDRFYITEDNSNYYFGFDVSAKDKGISYGLYIDVDNIAGSGGATDKWGKAVTAVQAHLPEIQIYAYHKDSDSWSSSSPKYYSWDASATDWVSASGGMGSLPEGGRFAVDTTDRFFEIVIPKDAPGFNNTDSFFVELFTVGETDGAGASESIPSDTTIQFTTENTSTTITILSNFYGYNVSTSEIPDSNLIHVDGDPSDWIELDIAPLATDTDNAQNGTEYKMDSLYVFMDSSNVYFGFRTPAETIGLHFGIYIDTDSSAGSGGTNDKWGAGVTAVDNHLPDVSIYAYHGDTGAWSGSSPKYYTWSGSEWEQHTGGEGSLPTGGKFAHDADLDFVELMIPRSSPGFENITSFYILLFNFGSEKYVSESVPSDTAVSFSGENTSQTVQLSNFAYFEYCELDPNPSGNTEEATVPVTFQLYQNYPNPFNPTTNIKYSIPTDSRVKLTIYDMLGREIRTLVNEQQTIGYKQILWDGKDNNGRLVCTGCYIYQLKTDKGYTKVLKMLLLK
ncbi:metallophosphoesterase [bacterium]|nr:metallophosphoesterase [Bacteroidota bacterium]MBU1634370.1 metallophosphoesterase [bacterium]